MRETGVRSLDREDPLEKEMATRSSILAWRIPWTEEPRGRKELDTTERLHFTSLHFMGLLVEEAVAPHSSTLAWKIPWMEEPGRLQSTGS